MPYRSNENIYIVQKSKEILILYHKRKISKTEFNRRMAELYGEPMHFNKYFGQKKEEK